MRGIRWGVATDTGRVRSSNQDRSLASGVVFAVADGMGGHLGGEVAAEVALEALGAELASAPQSASALAQAVGSANRAVWERAASEAPLRGMGTTLTALAVLAPDEEAPHELALAHVGDSRAYRLSQGNLTMLTADHNLAGAMLRRGELSSSEATGHRGRHILTRALGVDPDVEVDSCTLAARAGDRYLLCSDGLVNEVSDAEIAEVLAAVEDPERAAWTLVERASDHGGNDNITAVVLDVLQVGSPPERGPARAAAAAGTGAAAAGSRRRLFSSHAHGHEAVPASDADRRLTLRVALFVVVLVVIVGGAFAAMTWYARHTYEVVLDRGAVVIERGLPGGILWLSARVVDRTRLRRDTVPSSSLGQLSQGMKEPSLAQARGYVHNLELEYALLHGAAGHGQAPRTATRGTTTTLAGAG